MKQTKIIFLVFTAYHYNLLSKPIHSIMEQFSDGLIFGHDILLNLGF